MAAATSTVLAIAAIAASVASTAYTLTQKPEKAPAAPQLPEAPGEDPADKARMEKERSDVVTRIRRRASGAGAGRASTLLTGADGVTDAAPTERKTLLGS